MELLKSIRQTADETEHWVTLNDSYTPPDLLALENFRQKIERALIELGRVNYGLQESLTSLRTDTADTHDCLHAQITELSEPELNRAMGDLADSIQQTMNLVDGVLADTRMRKQ